MLQGDQYSLILASALLSITVNPLMFRLIGPLERTLGRSAALGRWRTGPTAGRGAPVPHGGEHVVMVGCGPVGEHIVEVLGRIGVPAPGGGVGLHAGGELQAQGIPVLFGDAANSEILTHAGLGNARALVVTIPDEAAGGLAVAAARLLAPSLPIVARAATPSGVKHLLALGAQDVIHPELEGGLQVVRHTLLRLGFPLREVQKYGDIVRRDSYDVAVNSDAEHRALMGLLEAARSLEISWVTLAGTAASWGRSSRRSALRARTGASVVAIHRRGALIPNPAADLKLEADDRLGLIGELGQVEAALKVLRAPREDPPEPPVA